MATSNYVDLRPDNVREVQVLIDGTWRTGDLEACRKDVTGCRGFVRWSEGPGLHHLYRDGEPWQEQGPPPADQGYEVAAVSGVMRKLQLIGVSDAVVLGITGGMSSLGFGGDEADVRGIEHQIVRVVRKQSDLRVTAEGEFTVSIE